MLGLRLVLKFDPALCEVLAPAAAHNLPLLPDLVVCIVRDKTFSVPITLKLCKRPAFPGPRQHTFRSKVHSPYLAILLQHSPQLGGFLGTEIGCARVVVPCTRADGGHSALATHLSAPNGEECDSCKRRRVVYTLP